MAAPRAVALQRKIRKNFPFIQSYPFLGRGNYQLLNWHQLTRGIRRRWANKPFNTFTNILEAFRIAISYRFVEWLDENIDVFTAHKESLGLVWA